MHDLWVEILQLKSDQVGIDDSFFRLGGDSVAAMKLVAAAQREQVHLTVAEIFRTPILCELAALPVPWITENGRSETSPFELLPNPALTASSLQSAPVLGSNVDLSLVWQKANITSYLLWIF